MTVLDGSYDAVVPCESEIVAYMQTWDDRGKVTKYGSTREIKWVLRPDGIHLGIASFPLVGYAQRNGYVLLARCRRGHDYDLEPGQMLSVR